jgi:hypothetical protein
MILNQETNKPVRYHSMLISLAKMKIMAVSRIIEDEEKQ